MTSLMVDENNTALLYEQVAARISHLIDGGTFPPGVRIPSVRRLSREFGVSVSTVVEAYRRLENEGRIEARPQSGYYVRSASNPLLRRTGGSVAAQPGWSLPAPTQPAEVSVSEIALRLMRHTHESGLLQLGAAIPNPDLLPLAALHRLLAQVTREHPADAAAYGAPAGYGPLRAQIARRLLTAGVAIAPDELIITTGAQEAIYLALSVLCQPGDAVAVESPVFYGTLLTIESLGLKAVEIPAHPQDGISLEALAFVLERHPEVRACLVVSNYNNPLGSRIPDERKQALVEMLEAAGVPLIEDDLYGDITFEGEPRPICARKYDRTGNVLLCASFSKTLAPGYRVGWIAPGRWHAEIEKRKMVANLACVTPTQRALAEYLAGGGYDRHLRRIRRAYELQTRQMAEAVHALFPEGTQVTNPRGGFVLWAQMPEEVDAMTLYEQALKGGITTAPGPIFSARPGKFTSCIRLNGAFWSSRAEEALEHLGRLASRPANRGGAIRRFSSAA